MDDISEINNNNNNIVMEEKIPMEFDEGDMVFENNQCLSVCNRNNAMNSNNYQNNANNDSSYLNLLHNDDKRFPYSRLGLNQNINEQSSSSISFQSLDHQNQLKSNDLYIPKALKKSQYNSNKDQHQKENLLNPEQQKSNAFNYERQVIHGFNQERPHLAYIKQKNQPINTQQQQLLKYDNDNVIQQQQHLQQQCVCGDRPSAVCDALNHQTPFFMAAPVSQIVTNNKENNINNSAYSLSSNANIINSDKRQSSIAQIQGGGSTTNVIQSSSTKDNYNSIRVINLESIDNDNSNNNNINSDGQLQQQPLQYQNNIISQQYQQQQQNLQIFQDKIIDNKCEQTPSKHVSVNKQDLYRPHIANTNNCPFVQKLQQSQQIQLNNNNNENGNGNVIANNFSQNQVSLTNKILNIQNDYSNSQTNLHHAHTPFMTQTHPLSLLQPTIQQQQSLQPTIKNTAMNQQLHSDNFNALQSYQRFRKGLSGTQNYDNLSYRGSQYSQSGDTAEFKSAYGGGASVFNAFGGGFGFSGTQYGGGESDFMTARNDDQSYFGDYIDNQSQQNDIKSVQNMNKLAEEINGTGEFANIIGVSPTQTIQIQNKNGNEIQFIDLNNQEVIPDNNIYFRNTVTFGRKPGHNNGSDLATALSGINTNTNQNTNNDKDTGLIGGFVNAIVDNAKGNSAENGSKTTMTGGLDSENPEKTFIKYTTL